MNNPAALHIKEILSAFGQKHKSLGLEMALAPDHTPTLKFSHGGQTQTRNLSYKKTVTAASLGAITHFMQQETPNSILITPHLNMTTAELLHNEKIQFIDASGNAFLEQQGLYIYENGHRSVTLGQHTSIGQFSTPTTLKVAFTLLCEPKFLNSSYRELAQASKVALGSVPKAIELLKTKGYIITHSKQTKRLENRKKLIDQWVEVYPERLKAKALKGIFITPEVQWWKNCDIQEFSALWSGEVAGSLCTRDLLPFTASIYLSDMTKLPSLLKKFRFRKLNEVPQGHEPGLLYVYESFWETSNNFSLPNHPNVVNPLLVFADLLHTGEARNLSIAKLMHDQFLT
jgi:hypothetical protein